MEFGKLGLQHLLAISGFHFALIALFLHFFLRPLLPTRLHLLVVIALLTLYFLFLGYSPSVQRAYLILLLYLTGKLFHLRIPPLNALGVSLAIDLFISPLVIFHLGFQLSFLCTLAILHLYPLMNTLLNSIFPQRSSAIISEMPLLDKHGYLLSSLFRKTLAVNFAVHLLSIPVLLCCFYRFPLLSLGYNLFIPFATSISMLLLLLGLTTTALPFLSAWFHFINTKWTSSLLLLTSHPPAHLNFVIRTQSVSLSMTLFFLLAAFYAGIWFEKLSEDLGFVDFRRIFGRSSTQNNG